MEKAILKVWPDPVTAGEELIRMREEYEEQGYECQRSLGGLFLKLDDGVVAIYWQDGAFYQEIVPEAETE